MDIEIETAVVKTAKINFEEEVTRFIDYIYNEIDNSNGKLVHMGTTSTEKDTRRVFVGFVGNNNMVPYQVCIIFLYDEDSRSISIKYNYIGMPDWLVDRIHNIMKLYILVVRLNENVLVSESFYEEFDVVESRFNSAKETIDKILNIRSVIDEVASEIDTLLKAFGGR